MLRLMLGGHPGLYNDTEHAFLFDHYDHEAGAPGKLDVQALKRDRIFQDSLGRLREGITAEETILNMIEDLAPPPPQRLVIVIHRGLEAALRLLPESRVIHLVRDPRDVSLSTVKMGWAGTSYHGIKHWLRAEREWLVLADSITAELQHEVRYEDLVDNPEAVLTDIASFLGLPFDVGLLAYSESSTYSAPDRRLAAQWRTRMTLREARLIDGRLNGLHLRFGYAPADYTTAYPSTLERHWLEVMNFLGRWRYRIRTFGPIDPVLYTLARRLGLSQLEDRVRTRIDAKVRRQLK